MHDLNLCDYGQMQALLKQQGFHFSKSKGQNFLIQNWVPERIADAAGLDENTLAVEIGPGVGCLTEQLALRAADVLAFEVDEDLIPVLGITMQPYANVQVRLQDAMRVDLAQTVQQDYPGRRAVLCANLPYNITTPVLTHIYRSRCFETVTVMVQKEVAQRMCAGPGSKDYGAFSLLTQWYGEPEMLFTVGPECFMPRPKVTSAVVQITMRDTPPVQADEKELFRIIRAAFNMRRKTLVNALEGVCGKETVRQALVSCGLSETVRGEALTLAQFAALAESIYKK